MSPRCCPSPQPIDPGEDPDQALARLAKALSHPVRVRIVRILLERDECMVGTLVEELPRAQATVSQHLKVLRDAGLVYGEVEGRGICYCADPRRIEAMREWLASLTEPAHR